MKRKIVKSTNVAGVFKCDRRTIGPAICVLVDVKETAELYDPMLSLKFW